MQQLIFVVTRRLLSMSLIATLVLAASPLSAQTSSPDGWLDGNVNGGTGTWSFNDEGFTVTGSGTDIWGTADSFHFAYQVLNGDGVFRARVRQVSGTQDWTKVGLMIRQSLDPGSPHHFLLASKGKGLHYQRRPTAGSASLDTPLTTPGTVVWYRIVRAGDHVQLGMSGDGVNWQTVATVNWPSGPTLVGFAVTSHDASTTATAFGRFDNVALTGNGRTAPFVQVLNPEPGDAVQTSSPYKITWQANTTDGDPIDHFNLYLGFEQSGAITYQPIAGCATVPGDARSCTWSAPGPVTDAAHILVVATDSLTDQGADDSGRFTLENPSTGLPAGWSSDDIGAVSAAGSATGDGSSFTVRGSGADIWGTADEFHFVHKTMTGDFAITARVLSVDAVHSWTKGGLMIRESLSPGSRHGSFFATPTLVNGTAFQHRDGEGQTTTSISGPDFKPPVWLKLVKRSNTITAYYRHATTDLWTETEYQVFNAFADTVEVGLAVTSHYDGLIATAQFSDVVVESLPAWRMGGIASKGNLSTDQTIFGLFGPSSDIWGTADSMEYALAPWVGDGTMTARIRRLENSDLWEKAGVMFRESLTGGSKHVFGLLSPGHGLNLQYRATTGGQTASAAGSGVAGGVPEWLRLTRTGDTFLFEVSKDFVTWQAIGSVTVQMGQTVYVGLAHTSHDLNEAGGAVFDDVRVTR